MNALSATLRVVPSVPAADTRGTADLRAPAYALRRVALTDFRSYTSLRLAVDARPVVLTGGNGAGKTNLLEAVSFLAPGRGLRRARLSEVGHRLHLGRGWGVAIELDTPDGAHEIGTGLEGGQSPENADEDDDEAGETATTERRLVRLNGTPAKSQSILAELLTMLWLTPEMDRLFMDSASGRRRFFDRIAFAFVPEHARRLNAYERALRERQRLLRDGPADASWLSALELALAENGVAVAAARLMVLAQLSHAVAETHGAFPQPAIALSGAVEERLATMPALAVEDWFKASLARNRRLDAESGRAQVGPHRSDLRVRHVEKDMPAEMCSTGEQKALLIAFTLATARLIKKVRGTAPILLLDEIAAHLDERRRRELFDEITALGSQAWLTGTDTALFAPLKERAQFLTVAQGAVVPNEME